MQASLWLPIVHQEVEANQIPMLLVSIGWSVVQVFVGTVEIDSCKGISVNSTAKKINSSFANRFAY
jgi:hypothetical protein